MRFREIRWGSWWRLRELCEAPRCLLWRGLRHHCPMYNVSCVFFYKCLYFSYYMAGSLLDRPLYSTRRDNVLINLCTCPEKPWCVVQRVLAKHEIIQMTQTSYSQYLASYDFWFFQKLKSPLKGKRFHTVDETKENKGCWWRLGELCEVPRCLLWRGLWHHCPMYNVFVSRIFFNKCLYFS